MEATVEILIAIGGILLLGIVTDYLGAKTKLPRVTLLLAFGFVIGPSVLGWIPKVVEGSFPLITKIAIAMIGFLLGGELTLARVKASGRKVFVSSLIVVIITLLIVTAGLWFIGTSLLLALLLAACSAATDPVATLDVIDQTRSKGPFVDLLKDIVAVDDVWCLLSFSLILVLVNVLIFSGGDVASHLLKAAWEIFGSVIAGVIIGFPVAFLTGRLKPGEPTLLEALGVVAATTGFAIYLHLSFLLTLIVVGIVVTNFAKHHTRPFNAIENAQKPFLILFFVLAGSQMQIHLLLEAGFVGFMYIVLRLIGRLLGGWLAAVAIKESPVVKRWLGLSLLPQAGVAIGMALMASQLFPEAEKQLLPIVLGACAFFEIVGPLFTRVALRRCVAG